MTTPLSILIAISLLAHPPIISQEVVRSTDGVLTTVTNAGTPYAPYTLCLVVPPSDGSGDPEVFMRWDGPRFEPNRNLPDPVHVAGPFCWGVVDGAVFSFVHMRPMFPAPPRVDAWYLRHSQIDVVALSIDDAIIGERAGWSSDVLSREFLEGIFTYGQEYGCRVIPLIQYIKDNSEELATTWDLWFDVVYTSLNDVTAVAVRGGRMFVWDLQGTGIPLGEWSLRGGSPFETAIDGPFRIVRAGADLQNVYFIDETGAIYTGVGNNHEQIGTVRTWSSGDPDTLTLLFEDQKTRRIGFIHAAADNSMTVLPIDWTDESRSSDFLRDLESDDLRANLDRVADILRDSRE